MASQPSAAAEWDAEVAGGAFENFYSFGNRVLCETYPSKAGSNSLAGLR